MGPPSPDVRSAIVTGASSGIGRAMAIALAAKGFACILVSRWAEALRETAGMMATTARILTVDFTDLALTESVAARLAGLSRVDVLVHCAGVFESNPIASASVADFDRMHAVNLRGAFQLTQCLLPRLEESCGQIVFMNSSAVQRPSAGLAAYAASKAGLKAFADVLREEVNAKGIRVISVFPGRTASPMQESIFNREGRDYHPERLLQPEDIAAAVLNSLDLPRTAEVTDLHIRPFQKA